MDMKMRFCIQVVSKKTHHVLGSIHGLRVEDRSTSGSREMCCRSFSLDSADSSVPVNVNLIAFQEPKIRPFSEILCGHVILRALGRRTIPAQRLESAGANWQRFLALRCQVSSLRPAGAAGSSPKCTVAPWISVQVV